MVKSLVLGSILNGNAWQTAPLLPIPAESLVSRPEADPTTPSTTETIVAHDMVVVDVRVDLDFHRF